MIPPVHPSTTSSNIKIDAVVFEFCTVEVLWQLTDKFKSFLVPFFPNFQLKMEQAKCVKLFNPKLNIGLVN